MVNNNIYIASPLGFSEAGRFFMYGKLYPLIQEAGYNVIDPWALVPERSIKEVVRMEYGIEKKKAWELLNMKIGKNNMEGIDESAGVLAILDGVDVDSGTAAEIGYCTAKSKRILGYRNDFRLSSDNEGSTVNIQVEYFVRLNSGLIVHSLESVKKYLPILFPL